MYFAQHLIDYNDLALNFFPIPSILSIGFNQFLINSFKFLYDKRVFPISLKKCYFNIGASRHVKFNRLGYYVKFNNISLFWPYLMVHQSISWKCRHKDPLVLV